jgi:TetR/AcrR family transcriptional regulator, cholesterol catabolism regulator
LKKSFKLKGIQTKVSSKKIIKNTHARIFNAACKLFSQKGYHSTTMREIALESGINVAYLYNFISSKNDILYLFYLHLYEKLNDMLRPLQDLEVINPVQDLIDYIRIMVKYAHVLRKEILTMYSESRHLDRDNLKSSLELDKQNVNFLKKLIRRGVDSGDFKTKDSHLAANICYFMLVIEPLRGWNLKDSIDIRYLTEFLTESIFHILGASYLSEVN